MHSENLGLSKINATTRTTVKLLDHPYECSINSPDTCGYVEIRIIVAILKKDVKKKTKKNLKFLFNKMMGRMYVANSIENDTVRNFTVNNTVTKAMVEL